MEKTADRLERIDRLGVLVPQLVGHAREVIEYGKFKNVFIELIGTPMKFAKITTLVNQVKHVAESKRSPHPFVMILN